jgi:hypothetical protein
MFSQRVQQWMCSVSERDAELIQRVAARDPDYQADMEPIIPLHANHGVLFNPAWDMDY